MWPQIPVMFGTIPINGRPAFAF